MFIVSLRFLSYFIVFRLLIATFVLTLVPVNLLISVNFKFSSTSSSLEVHTSLHLRVNVTKYGVKRKSHRKLDL